VLLTGLVYSKNSGILMFLQKINTCFNFAFFIQFVRERGGLSKRLLHRLGHINSHPLSRHVSGPMRNYYCLISTKRLREPTMRFPIGLTHVALVCALKMACSNWFLLSHFLSYQGACFVQSGLVWITQAIDLSLFLMGL